MNSPDQAIFDAAQAFKEAEVRYAACAARCDEKGHISAEDEVELKASFRSSEAAQEIICDTRPETMAGARAILEYLAADKSGAPNDAAANLLGSPLFALAA
jgi:hypothetical protein